MPGFLLAILGSPWVQTVLKPLLAHLVIKLVERYQSDPQFKAALDAAAGSVKNAQTSQEKLDAAKQYQDALFR